MQHLGGHRIFADHYQYYLFDGSVDPYDIDEEWSEATTERGYIAGPSVIHVGTRAHLNDHWIDVYVGSPSSSDSPEIEHRIPISLPSGRLKISSVGYGPDDEPTFEIPPDDYAIVIRGFNLGSEDAAAGDLDDASFATRRELERYEVFLAS